MVKNKVAINVDQQDISNALHAVNPYATYYCAMPQKILEDHRIETDRIFNFIGKRRHARFELCQHKKDFWM